MNKKIFVMAYARKNLGDDLFIKMLLEKYPNVNFHFRINEYNYLEQFEKYPNIKISIGNDTDTELFLHDVNEFDGYIYIGGSIFMEGGKVYNLSEKFKDFVYRCKQNNKFFCYVSCNFGPYQTQEYINLARENYTLCNDICFRDKYSYELFEDIKTVRYAPDLAFSYKIDDCTKIKDSIGISVIDFSIRDDIKHLETEYLECLKNNILEYINQGKKIYLYSFCKCEGDENAIEKLISKIDCKENVTKVYYDGNIEQFLKVYFKMEYMICARFHAMVLSSISNQKIYVMSYSKKINNVIEDLKFNFVCKNLKDINKEIINLNEFKNVEKSKIERIKEESKNQIKFIDEYLKK